MFDIDLDDLDTGDAANAGDGLFSGEWNLRRDACKKLQELGEASKAEPHLHRLKELSLSDPDYEVKKAARRALASLRERGAQFPAAPAPGDACASEAGGAAGSADPGCAYAGPRVLIKIFKETLPMRIERDMTPLELTEVWERHWGVQYASRVKFENPPGSATKYMNPREDLVPRAPAVVTLYASVGSILLALSTALKIYGLLPEEEVPAERERRRLQQAAGSERRQEADAKEQERWRRAEFRRQQRREEQGEGYIMNTPFVVNKPLGGQSVAGL